MAASDGASVADQEQDPATDRLELRFTTTSRAGARTVAVVGEVDLTNATEFERVLGEAVAGAGSAVVVDLTGVDYLGSEGIRSLVRVHRAAVDLGVAWQVSPSPIVRRALEVAGLDPWLTP